MLKPDASQRDQTDEADSARVLIIEDDPIDAAILANVVRPTGWRLLFERDLEAARARIENEQVQLVISDLLLPTSLPDQSLATLQSFANRLPVIVVTGWSGNLVAYLLQEQNGIVFFDKNRFDPDAFLAVASTLIDRRVVRPCNPFSRRAGMVQFAAAAAAATIATAATVG